MQMSLYRMLTDWDESVATWNSFGQPGGIGGVQASEGESTDLPPDAVLSGFRDERWIAARPLVGLT